VNGPGAIKWSLRDLELDETLAATFPCSDPLSSNPFTPVDQSEAADLRRVEEHTLQSQSVSKRQRFSRSPETRCQPDAGVHA
jgi:hypothetical protein